MNSKCQGILFISLRHAYCFCKISSLIMLWCQEDWWISPTVSVLGPKNTVSTSTYKMMTEGVSLTTSDSPWWICPAGTGRCCVLLERLLAQYGTALPGSLSHARRSCHPRPRGQRSYSEEWISPCMSNL